MFNELKKIKTYRKYIEEMFIKRL